MNYEILKHSYLFILSVYPLHYFIYSQDTRYKEDVWLSLLVPPNLQSSRQSKTEKLSFKDDIVLPSKQWGNKTFLERISVKRVRKWFTDVYSVWKFILNHIYHSCQNSGFYRNFMLLKLMCILPYLTLDNTYGPLTPGMTSHWKFLRWFPKNSRSSSQFFIFYLQFFMGSTFP